MQSADERKKKIWAVIRVSSGNFLEMYDFMVFGYYAAAIGRVFFPKSDPYASLMLSLMTFAAGYLMRPIGALVLGGFADRHGRRAGLMLSLSMMSLGILSIACVPGYKTIGVAAPLLVLGGRLLQGFSAGMELGGVSVYLSEIATPKHRGFYVSWQSASQQIAVMFAAVIGITLNRSLSNDQLNAWGWRIPLLVGCLIVPLLLRLRKNLEETEEFKHRKQARTSSELLRELLTHWKLVLVATLAFTMTTVSFYMITAYTPTFGTAVLHFSSMDSFIVTFLVGASNLFWLPIMGALSDRIGRTPLLFACTGLMIVTAYPAMLWLVAAPTFGKLVTVELWLSFIYASYNGALIVLMTELIPFEVRTVAFSLAYSFATAIFGGFTPAISTWLIQHTGNRAIPGVWLSFAAVLGLISALITRAKAKQLKLPDV